MFRTFRSLPLAALLAVPASAQEPQGPEIMPKPAVIMPKPATEEPKPEPGIEIENRGPIHEGFAQPGAPVRGKDMTAPKDPPPNVPEIPPEQKPDGSVWVPGYWQWDADKKDFLWVSGFYRVPPQGRLWTAGQWKNQNGVQTYSPGYWRPADQNSWRVDLPEPPANLDNGPNTPAPADNMVWAQGSWQYQNGRYAWQPGQWVQPGEGLMWQQPQYVATPHGFCHVPGYWDYPLEYRGMLNAPVFFTQPLWNTPGWGYTPRFAVGVGYGNNGWGVGGFYNSLFIGPGFNNLYFGNYYGSGFAFGIGFGWGGGFNNGYRPWNYRAPGYCNPLYTQYAYLNRNNPAWAANLQAGYAARGAGVAPRPPVSLVNNAAVNAPRPGAGAGAAMPAAAAVNPNASRPRPGNQALGVNAGALAQQTGVNPNALVRPTQQVANQPRPQPPAAVPATRPNVNPAANANVGRPIGTPQPGLNPAAQPANVQGNPRTGRYQVDGVPPPAFNPAAQPANLQPNPNIGSRPAMNNPAPVVNVPRPAPQMNNPAPTARPAPPVNVQRPAPAMPAPRGPTMAPAGRPAAPPAAAPRPGSAGSKGKP